MLTLDDLDHFTDRSTARPSGQPSRPRDAETLARLARIVACLNVCRDIPDDELIEGGLHSARRVLKSLLRGEQRERLLRPEELRGALEGALRALGAQAGRAAETADAAEQRHAVEAEIQDAAARLADAATLDPFFLGTLARGEFELLPSSDVGPLSASGSLSTSATIDVDLLLDATAPAEVARVHLVIECGLWRWTARDGCCMSRNGNGAQFLAPDDALVQALLAGLRLRGGRAVLAWAESLGVHC